MVDIAEDISNINARIMNSCTNRALNTAEDVDNTPYNATENEVLIKIEPIDEDFNHKETNEQTELKEDYNGVQDHSFSTKCISNENDSFKSPKKKCKRQSELERLGIEPKHDSDSSFYSYTDNVQIYRKYKLREKIVKSEEPTSIVGQEKEPFSCPKCSRTFETNRALSSHLRLHQFVYKCLLCYEEFKENEDLMAHKSTHNQISFVCGECKLAFSRHIDYLIHNATHLTSPFECHECDLLYSRKDSYVRHIKTHCQEPLICSTCDLKFFTEADFKTHRFTHLYKFESQECVECGLKVSGKEFESHMAKHTGVKRYQCLYCGKCFVSDVSRNLHTRIHTVRRQINK